MRAQVAEWSCLQPHSLELDLELAGQRLRGNTSGLRGGALRLVHASSMKGRQLMRFWINHLCCCASGAVDGNSELLSTDATTSLRPLAGAQARQLLLQLLDIHAEGMRRPLPLFIDSAWSYARELARGGDRKQGMARARSSFEGSERERGEAADPCIARCFQDSGSAIGEEFANLAERVFTPLLAAIDGQDDA
jgi:exodeoxyribonuclease V gamma subunit